MSESVNLGPECPLLRLIRHSMKIEGAAELKGDYHGVPFFVVVATGATAGLMERFARDGTLRLTPDVTPAGEQP
jgi:hypothetical protein